MRTPISSVDTNLELLGYRGAALLDRLMLGKPPPSAPIRIPAAGLIVRKSSDILAVNHPGVSKSLRFICDHAHEPITVRALAALSGMSRRGLHQAFLDQIHRTPGEEIRRLRLERAKQMLAESTHKIETIAEMCGYQSANSFGISFKKAIGMAPKKFRDSLIS
jgi:LacI family transcriptional regulator